MAQKIASKLKINGIQYRLKDDSALTEEALQQKGFATYEQVQGVVRDNLLNYPDRQEVEELIQQGTSGYVTQGQLTNTIGDINALLDTINGEQI